VTKGYGGLTYQYNCDGYNGNPKWTLMADAKPPFAIGDRLSLMAGGNACQACNVRRECRTMSSRRSSGRRFWR
jgi:hypothetical protein